MTCQTGRSEPKPIHGSTPLYTTQKNGLSPVDGIKVHLHSNCNHQLHSSSHVECTLWQSAVHLVCTVDVLAPQAHQCHGTVWLLYTMMSRGRCPDTGAAFWAAGLLVLAILAVLPLARYIRPTPQRVHMHTVGALRPGIQSTLQPKHCCDYAPTMWTRCRWAVATSCALSLLSLPCTPRQPGMLSSR